MTVFKGKKPFSPQVNAKLTVLPPEKMLNEATIIGTGEVTKIEKGTNGSEESFGIFRLIKF
ncbi:MAG: hypothetical protein FIA99_02020 [Ruminiclostridium sp.]|nr:hypothetical protein [Ruminiclostridium sp.]